MSEKTNHQPTPPDEWFQFVTVGNKRNVKVGFSKTFEDDLAEKRDEIFDKLIEWRHFLANSVGSQEKIDKLKAELDILFKESTGLTIDSVYEKKEKLGEEFNSSSNPLQAAIESGLTRLYRGDE